MAITSENSVKSYSENFRKQNYWTTQNVQDATAWYAWNSKVPAIKNSTEEPSHNKKKEIVKVFKEDLRTYLLSSTLHGLRYIGEKKLTWFESYKADSEINICVNVSRKSLSDKDHNLENLISISNYAVCVRKPKRGDIFMVIVTTEKIFFWLAAFISSIIGAGFFIMNVYDKWRSSPMIVSINPQNMALNNLPFPAITICNVNQAKKSVAERYAENGDPVDKKLLQSLCTTRDDTEIFEDEIAGSADWDHTRSFLINVTQPCSELLALCEWDSKLMDCQDLFNAQLTDEGLCCTFNVVHRNNMFRNPKDLNDLNLTFPLPAVDWTPEGGYPPDAPADGFPWRPRGIGTHHGLTLVLDANIAEYYCGSTKSAGFKMHLHNPTETPKIRNIGEIYGPGIEARVVIRPRVMDAQGTLKSIDIKKRLCLFSVEKELVFYRTYTLKNCEMECEARAMLDVCKCVYYYMPKNKSTRVCGKSDARCYSNLSLIMPEGLDVTCLECLPACTEIAYFERVSTAPLTRSLVRHLAESLNSPVEYFMENMLVIHFYFEENTFVRFTKGEIFGLTEFLSNTGGLLGLCMGFSVMSLVELLYYLTLRAFCNARQRIPKQPFTK